MSGILGVSAEAAQKRVNRTVQELRQWLFKLGVGVGTTALVVLVSGNAVQAAPSGLAGTISTGVASAVPTVAGTTAASAKAVGLTLLQKALLVPAAVALVGTCLHQARQASQLQRRISDLESQLAAKGDQPRENHSDPWPIVSSLQPEIGGSLGSNPVAIARNASNLAYPSSFGQWMTQFGAQQGKRMESWSRATARDIGIKAVNGNTIVVYHGQERFVGSTLRAVFAKSANVNGKEYDAAFDDGRIIWENVPGAAEQLK